MRKNLIMVRERAQLVLLYRLPSMAVFVYAVIIMIITVLLVLPSADISVTSLCRRLRLRLRSGSATYRHAWDCFATDSNERMMKYSKTGRTFRPGAKLSCGNLCRAEGSPLNRPRAVGWPCLIKLAIWPAPAHGLSQMRISRKPSYIVRFYWSRAASYFASLFRLRHLKLDFWKLAFL